MRTTLPCIALLLATTTSARADKKIQSMTPGFVKELSACQIEVRGLTRMVTGTTALVATLQGSERDELGADLATLTTATATVTSYCTEVEGMVKFLQDNASTAYKSVERDIDTRDNAVRKLRREAKKASQDITPLTRKLIPRLKRTPAPDVPAPRADTIELASKRKVVLPKLGDGTFAVSGSSTSDVVTYKDKAGSVSVTTRPFHKISCHQQRKAFTDRSDAPATELEMPADGKTLGIAWSARVTTRSVKAQAARALLGMCIERGMGGVMVVVDIVPAHRKTLDAELTKFMVAMLAANVEGMK